MIIQIVIKKLCNLLYCTKQLTATDHSVKQHIYLSFNMYKSTFRAKSFVIRATVKISIFIRSHISFRGHSNAMLLLCIETTRLHINETIMNKIPRVSSCNTVPDYFLGVSYYIFEC